MHGDIKAIICASQTTSAVAVPAGRHSTKAEPFSFVLLVPARLLHSRGSDNYPGPAAFAIPCCAWSDATHGRRPGARCLPDAATVRGAGNITRREIRFPAWRVTAVSTYGNTRRLGWRRARSAGKVGRRGRRQHARAGAANRGVVTRHERASWRSVERTGGRGRLASGFWGV